MKPEVRATILKSLEKYHPCETGLHVCGVDEEANSFYTVANYPASDDADAKRMFDAAKAECCTDPDYDFVVDLMVGEGECVEDFGMTRQMLNRLAALTAPEPKRESE